MSAKPPACRSMRERPLFEHEPAFSRHKVDVWASSSVRSVKRNRHAHRIFLSAVRQQAARRDRNHAGCSPPPTGASTEPSGGLGSGSVQPSPRALALEQRAAHCVEIRPGLNLGIREAATWAGTVKDRRRISIVPIPFLFVFAHFAISRRDLARGCLRNGVKRAKVGGTPPKSRADACRSSKSYSRASTWVGAQRGAQAERRQAARNRLRAYVGARVAHTHSE